MASLPGPVWRSPQHSDWGRLVMEDLTDSIGCSDWCPPSANNHMPWGGKPVWPTGSHLPCLDAIDFLSNELLRQQAKLEIADLRAGRLGEEIVDLKRQLALKEARTNCGEGALQRYPSGAPCRIHCPDIGQLGCRCPPTSTPPSFNWETPRSWFDILGPMLPEALLFAEYYFGFKLSVGEEPKAEEFEETFTQITMFGCGLDELRAILSSVDSPCRLAQEQWVDILQKRFPGFPLSLIDHLQVIVNVLIFSCSQK